MTLIVFLACASTLLFVAAWVAARCLSGASANVRKTVWRAAFAGTAVLPVLERAGASSPVPSFVPSLNAVAIGPVTAVSSSAVVDVPWLLAVWAAGCFVVVGRFVVSLVRVWRWTRSGDRDGVVTYSSTVSSPLTWGALRPRILLPTAAREWPPENVEMALRHETAHIESRDWAWQTFARLVTAALWFNPVVWRADRQLRREAEKAADDAVLVSGAEPTRYAGQLVTAARAMSRRPVASAVGMAASSLEERVRHVLDERARRGPGSWLVRGLVMSCFVALTASAAALQDAPVYKAGDEGVTLPVLVREVKPVYSADAMERRVEGEVILEAIVNVEGSLDDLRVVRSLDPSLDRAAMDAALQWRFEPGRKDGRSVRVRVNLQFHFSVK